MAERARVHANQTSVTPIAPHLRMATAGDGGLRLSANGRIRGSPPACLIIDLHAAVIGLRRFDH